MGLCTWKVNDIFSNHCCPPETNSHGVSTILRKSKAVNDHQAKVMSANNLHGIRHEVRGLLQSEKSEEPGERRSGR